MTRLSRQHGAMRTTVMLALGSLVALGVLLLGLMSLSGAFTDDVHEESLLVYCAAGMKKPVTEAIEQYEKELGVRVRVIYGNSGFLLGQIGLKREGDLYIPADASYVEQGRAYVDPATNEATPLLAEAIPLAQFRLCIAVQPGNPKNIATLEDLLRNDVTFSRAAPKAGVGKMTKQMLEQAGRWDAIVAATKVEKQTVNEVAQDVQIGAVDAGFVWDTLAKQHGLDVVYPPEFDAGVATIQAAVLTDTKQPTAALRFARFLAAPERGKLLFDKYHYGRLPGDKWAVQPRITLYSGTVSRPAIEEMLEAFRRREGVDLRIVFNGCGNLVSMMKSGQMPDAYLACDISYRPWMEDTFKQPRIVSEMDLVMLVRPGNPDNITTLEDLTRPQLKVGIANPEHSALGGVTRAMLRDAGLYDAVMRNGPVLNAGGDLLVQNMLGGKTLDAVVVYGANCLHIGEEAQIIRLDRPGAVAVQPWWRRENSDHPQLMDRLYHAITSAQGRSRYEQAGFRFMAADNDDDAPATNRP